MRLVEVAGGDQRQPVSSGRASIRPGRCMAQPERVAVVGDDQVEGAIGGGVEMRQRLGGGDRIGVVERLEHQFAARALTGRGPSEPCRFSTAAATPQSLIPSHEPPAKQVEPGDDFGPVGPMAAGRQGGAVDHLVAVGPDQHRPAMLGPAEDHQRAHSPSRAIATDLLGNLKFRMPPMTMMRQIRDETT